MAVIGITGSIASGKSTFRDLLADRLGADVFDADVAAKEFLESEAREKVVAAFGPSVYRADGKADREALRRLIFERPEAKRTLEGILHPLVRGRWSMMALDPGYQSRHLLVDIPLLFETGADRILRFVVTVACSPEVQSQRLGGRGLDEQTAQRIIATQMPVSEKIRRSACVVWNDGSLEALAAQADLLAERIRKGDPLT